MADTTQLLRMSQAQLDQLVMRLAGIFRPSTRGGELLSRYEIRERTIDGGVWTQLVPSDARREVVIISNISAAIVFVGTRAYDVAARGMLILPNTDPLIFTELDHRAFVQTELFFATPGFVFTPNCVTVYEVRRV